MNNLIIDISSMAVATSEECLPQVSCVYFLYYEDEVVYVGQAKNLALRIFQHKEDARIGFDTLRWVEIDGREERSICEHYHIKVLNPKFNRTNFCEETIEQYRSAINERGQIIQKPKKHKFSRERSDEPDYLLYSPGNKWCANLQRQTIGVMWELFKHVNKENEIAVPLGIKNRIGKILELDANTIDQHLLRLSKARVLKRIDGGLYFLNPLVGKHPEYYK